MTFRDSLRDIVTTLDALGSRRKYNGRFVALVGGAFLSSLPVEMSTNVAGIDTLKIALVGCSSRGAGLVAMPFEQRGSVKLDAMAEIFGRMVVHSG